IRFFGRIDDQIKIRGYRVELQEIEIVLKSYNSIKDAIVLTRENNTGESEICAYYVSETGTLNKPSLREYIEKRLPSYMIPAHLLELEKIPLTPNGKVDKNALPGPVADSSGEYLPPRTEIEKKLVEIWENVLGVKKIGINDNFFAVGGDSIKTIQIASRLNTAGYRLQMKDIFNYPTISQLASLVKLEQSTAEQSEVTGTIPLTPVQRWFFEEPFPAPHHFNQAVMFYAPEGFDKQILINVFTRIQEHHDILRATYRKNPYNKEIIQIIDGGDYPLSFREYDLKKQENSLTEFNHKINEIQAGIELENGPLMKLGLFHLDDGDRLLIVIHHLAIDGVSWRILFEDIETLYSQYKRGEKPVLPPKTGSFKQWSEKLSLYADSKTFLKEKIYWAQLEEKSVPEIKKDFEIEANIEKDIQGLSFTLDQEETNLLLTKVNRAYKTEINDILLTALGLGIKKAFSHDRLLVALEGHGREEILEGIDINRTVGWFTSVYPVMLDMCHMGDPGRQIKEIKETLRRIPNKGMGYGILKYLTAAEHKKELEFKLKPQISFNYLGQFDADVKKISFFQIAKESPGHSQSLNNRREYLFDVGGMIANKRLTMTISYNQTHFKPETVAALSNHFEAELKSLIAFCSTREKTGPTPADFTYKGLSIETVDRLIKEYPGLEDIYTLTPMQEGMLFHALIDEKSSSYFEQTSYRLEGELNIALVEKSLNELFKRHDILRTAFVHKESERRVQVVLCDRTVDFYYEDISKIEEKENFVHEFKIQDKARSFDLSKETLMRVGILKLGNSEYEFTWSFHHILMDGWCVGIINSEFFEIYNSYLENRPYRLPQLKPYRTYIEWLEKQDKEKSAEYWKNYLYSYEEQVGVPKTVVMKTQASEPAYKNEQVVIILDREKTAHLEKLAAVNHVTLNIATQVIWGILLGKYNGKEDVVFGAVVSGRPFQLESVESILGLFINTVPVRIKFTEIMEFRALLQKVQEEALAAEPYHYSPLAEIQAGSVLKQNLIDHLFIFENYPIADQIEGYGDNGNKKNGLKLKLTHIDVFEQTNYDFNIILAGVEKLRIVLRYNGHVYDNNYVKKIAEHLNLIIDHVIANPSTPVVDIEIISEATKKELLNYFNENLYEALAIIPIQSHLANAFLKYSANTACEYGTIHLTYARLEHRAGCISQWLRNHNIPVGSFIGIYIEAKTDIIAAIIGILQRGCIFVPLDTALPEKRIESMIRLTNMKVILTDTAHEIKLTGMKEDIDIFIIDESFFYSHEPERNNIEEIKYDPEDKIYVYFSSGSTGQPNAVLGRNKSLVQFLQWEIETFAVTENDRISQLTAVGFDAFLRDVFVPLLAGGTSCIPGSKEILLEAGTFITWLDSNHISLVHCVPSLFRIIDTKQLTPSSFSRLKYVLLSGEPINPTELQDWYRVFGPRIQLVNYYGPTETTMIKTFHPITMNDIETGKIPAGRPIRGSRIIILDKHMKICDRGITGEIYIRTAYGTYGYLHNPALNAQRFIKNPFSEGEGDLIYKTGDLGRQLENGEIEVLGRIDRQVKIRGVRIELENIENCLLKHDKIERTIVISRKSETGENFLCAYIIYKKEENQTVPAASELREHLSKELPDYMIPLYFVPIEKIPLTPNGKIDIKALPVHEIKSDGGFIAPRNAMEEKLAELWEEILGIKKESISIDANFFDLGGHSLTTTTLLSRIHRDLDVRIPLAEMFKTPNIKGLSAYIKSLETETGQLPEDKYAAIEPVEEKEYYPLSSAQKRLYFLQELDLQGIGYNMPLVLPLGNEI
ncbi:MAG TPA: amino acid adenylation domain-containing protein, partial [Candidatus Kapabacteria bacterium]|nr:amino acid adenylation domain-containing protein [Candidatus Kapabacteria bacterium]